MKTELRRLLQSLLTVTYMASLATGCGGGGGGASAGPDDPPVAEEEQAVVGQALVGAAAYPDPAAEAKIATIGTVLAANPTGHVYQVQLKDGVSVADAQSILGGDILYVEKNYLAHPFAAVADPDWAGGPQYGATVKLELERAWTAAGQIPGPQATIDGVTSSSTGATVKIAGTETFTAGDDQSGFDVTTDGATALAAAINGDSTLTTAGVSAVASGTSVILTLAPGKAPVSLAATGTITVSGPTLTGPTIVTIAVIDSGVNCAHEDLVNKCAAGENFTVTPAVSLAANASSDDVGHGTQVAGVAAAETGNGLGIAGIAGLGQGVVDPAVVKIVPVKVSSAGIPANHALIARGIDWAVNTLSPPADVIVISMGSSSSSFTLQKSIENAWKKGALVVAAAGNENVKVMRYPAAYQFTGATGQNVLSVTHVDEKDALVTGVSGSNTGTWVNLAAPGTNVIAPTFDPLNPGFTDKYTDGTGGYTKQVGSSYAAAFVAGAAALVKASYPSLTNTQLRNLLASSVETFDHAAGLTLAKTGGRLNVEKALALAATPTAKEVAGLVLSQSSVSGGLKVTGTVVLLNPNTSAATNVTLSSSDSTAAAVPATVSVPANATSATFTVTTLGVTDPKSVDIKAAVPSGTEVVAKLAVGVANVSKVVCSPASLIVGQTSTCTVTLDVPAPSGGVTVDVSSSGAAATASTATVTIPSGTTGTFTLTAASPGTVYAGAGIGNVTPVHSNDVTVAGVTLTVTYSSATVASGGTLSGKLTWNGKLPAETTVHFVTSDASVVGAPDDVVVKAGATSATFSKVVGTPDTTKTATLTASITKGTASTIAQAGANKDGTVTVQGIAVKTIDLTPTTLNTRTTLQGTVTLNSAPAGSIDVTLSLNTQLCYFDVPKVTVSGSAVSGSFKLNCADPAVKTTVVVTAQPAGTTAKTLSLTLVPYFSGLATYTTKTTTAKTTFKNGDVLDVVVKLSVAPANDLVVDLAVADADGSTASVPTLGANTVTVKAGETTGKTTLTGSGSSSGKVVLTASIPGDGTANPPVNGASVTSTLTYSVPALSSVAVSSTTLLMGGATTLTATLGAASTGTDVALTYSASGLSSPPATVSVTSGTSKTATLTAVSNGLSSSTPVTITGTLNGVTKTATVTVLPATFDTLGDGSNAASITASSTVQVPVALSGAQAITCTVVSHLTTGLTAPTTVAFTSSPSVNLALTAGAVSAGAGGTLDVTCGGVKKTLTVTIN